MKTTLFEKKSGPFYDAWEGLNEDLRLSHIQSALKEYILYAKQISPYYEEKLSGIDFNTTYPLKNVSPLSGDELRLLIPPDSQKIVAPNNGYTLFQSGGTTGKPKSTLFSTSELDALDLPNSRGFYATGLLPSDRVGNLFAVGSLYMTFIHINRMLQQYGCINFPFSNHTPNEFVHTVVDLYKINCLTGISSVVLNALRSFSEFGIKDIQIEKIYFGGEHLYPADKIEIQKKFGTKIIKAPGYGTVDTWYIGYQCLQTGDGVFHAHDDQTYLEIVNEETGQHVSYDEPGMLYATAFLRRVTPIVRYRVGDRAKWLKEKCSCGRTTPLFQLLGRGDDVLRIGYDSVDYDSIQKLVMNFPELSGSIRMEKEREEGRDRLVIKIETELPLIQRESVSQSFSHKLLELRPSLNEFVKKGTVWPVKVLLVDKESLPRNPKTGKLIRVVDARLS